MFGKYLLSVRIYTGVMAHANINCAGRKETKAVQVNKYSLARKSNEF